MSVERSRIEGQVDVGGCLLQYEVRGEGHPLVLIHAGIADMTMWDEQIEGFAQRYRVIHYDVRNLGRSRTGPVSYSNREDLRTLLRELGVESAHLLGISMGGSIAIDFTLERPEMVDALILVAAGLSGYEPSGPPPEQFAQIEASWEHGDLDRVLDLELQLWVDGPGQGPGRVDPQVRERVAQMERENLRNEVEGAHARPLDPPAAGRVKGIRAPTLVIVGDLDVPGIVQTSDFIASQVPRARKVVFKGVAHMVNMERPEDFSREVLEFLATVDKQRSDRA